MSNDGGPAFPQIDDGEVAGHQDGDGYHYLRLNGSPGMSLRDWFAGQWIVGAAAYWSSTPLEMRASEAYRMADAMLKAREQA